MLISSSCRTSRANRVSVTSSWWTTLTPSPPSRTTWWLSFVKPQPLVSFMTHHHSETQRQHPDLKFTFLFFGFPACPLIYVNGFTSPGKRPTCLSLQIIHAFLFCLYMIRVFSKDSECWRPSISPRRCTLAPKESLWNLVPSTVTLPTDCTRTLSSASLRREFHFIFNLRSFQKQFGIKEPLESSGRARCVSPTHFLNRYTIQRTEIQHHINPEVWTGRCWWRQKDELSLPLHLAAFIHSWFFTDTFIRTVCPSRTPSFWCSVCCPTRRPSPSTSGRCPTRTINPRLASLLIVSLFALFLPTESMAHVFSFNRFLL